ncbi:hypothetical protein MD484_g243, partial [Candolleomyces efflorescens]
MSRFTIIVAATKSNGIGQAGKLPWRLPKEIKYFAQVTSNAPEGKHNAVIMGRNTWESIPKKFRPLPGRLNVVITSQVEYDSGVSTDDTTSQTPKPFIANNLQSALARLNDPNIHRAFIIGGAYLYRETLKLAPATLIPPAASHLDPATDSTPYVDRILLTRVIAPEFEDCDVFMPEFRGPEFNGSLDRAGKWVQASHAELREWAGVDVLEGVQEENGIKYEFQMWTRDALEQAD